jgi:hypothetical protein
MQNKRAFLKSLSVIGAVASVEVWKKPVVNAVVLPAHAQTSVTTLSCSMTDTSLSPIADDATTNQNIILTFLTDPPMPGATINWIGRCNGLDEFAIQSEVLDANGKLEVTVDTSLFCSGGPPNNGDIILHNGILESEGSTASCSITYGP